MREIIRPFLHPIILKKKRASPNLQACDYPLIQILRSCLVATVLYVCRPPCSRNVRRQQLKQLYASFDTLEAQYGQLLEEHIGAEQLQCVLACIGLCLRWGAKRNKIGTFFVVPAAGQKDEFYKQHVEGTQLDFSVDPFSLSVMVPDDFDRLLSLANHDGGFLMRQDGYVMCANHSMHCPLLPPEAATVKPCHGGSAHHLCQRLTFQNGAVAIKLSEETRCVSVFAGAEAVCKIRSPSPDDPHQASNAALSWWVHCLVWMCALALVVSSPGFHGPARALALIMCFGFANWFVVITVECLRSLAVSVFEINAYFAELAALSVMTSLSRMTRAFLLFIASRIMSQGWKTRLALSCACLAALNSYRHAYDSSAVYATSALCIRLTLEQIYTISVNGIHSMRSVSRDIRAFTTRSVHKSARVRLEHLLKERIGDTQTPCVLACIGLCLKWAAKRGKTGTFFVVPAAGQNDEFYKQRLEGTQLDFSVDPFNLSVMIPDDFDRLLSLANHDGGFLMRQDSYVMCAKHSMHCPLLPPQAATVKRCHGGSANHLCQLLTFQNGAVAIKLSEEARCVSVFAGGEVVLKIPTERCRASWIALIILLVLVLVCNVLACVVLKPMLRLA